MGDIRGEKVENFKIPDEQKRFLRSFKRLKAIEKALKQVSFEKQMEFQGLKELWNSLNIAYDRLSDMAPQKVLRELPGMNFEEEGGGEETPDMRINY